MKMTVIRLFAAILLGLAVPPALGEGASPQAGGTPRAASPVPVYLFWSTTCPHCRKAKSFLEALSAREPAMKLVALELSEEGRHEAAFVAASRYFRVEPPAVPLIIVGDQGFAGYDDDWATGAEIRIALQACLAKSCADVGGVLLRTAGLEATAPVAGGAGPNATTRRPSLPKTVHLPIVGEVETRTLSLPALTVLLGAIDGFNPCAMWVLVFLIGLLVGMRDPVRMWSYGAVFLLTSAAVYMAFMAAWLNVFLFLGSLAAIRVGIGLFALGAGGYYLWQFISNPEAACPVTSPDKRQRVMTRLTAAIVEPSFALAILGIAVLAVAVNLIELLCSAGIPAVYTQVLALSDLSPGSYHAYLSLYIAVFLLDDVIVFVTAMLTLRAAGFTATYARFSHLIGAIVLVSIGALLVLKPEWLAFV